MDKTIDILMITFNRPRYTELSLSRLLETCDDTMRVWVWQNGNDRETIEVVESFKDHPRFYKYHHSIDNKKLNEPTNWLWKNSEANFLSKVDDDCLMPFEWGKLLKNAHESNPNWGAISCWLYWPEDINPEVSKEKIKTFNGHQLLQNCWVGGSGYLIKKKCIEQLDFLRKNQSFTQYCIELWARGWVNGWYFPVLHMEHMDDPKSEHSLLKSDNDFLKYQPLSAQNLNEKPLRGWQQKLIDEARLLQTASLDWETHLKARKRIPIKIKRWFDAISRRF